jgi:diacylglycerol kinase (ATP)
VPFEIVRAAVIFGLGTSRADLRPFQANSSSAWSDGVPASKSEADAVVLFGGDGTIHRHLSALVRLQLPVLIVPAGSGNDFARALKLHSQRDSLRVWRDFESGKIKPLAIDLGVIRSLVSPEVIHYFCGVAACGLDSAVAKRANEMPRWLRGHGGYVLAALPLLFNLPAFPLWLTKFDGGHESTAEKSTLLAAFANTPFYGDGMKIAPKADFTDGKLDICRVSTMNSVEVFCMFPTLYFGRHLTSRKVEYAKAERVIVETKNPIDIYADGEFVCQSPAEISIAKAALPFIYSP